MPSYKLTYFNARGLAELARLTFANANLAYEDARIPRDDWVNLKPNTPFGHLPILEINGTETVADSMAIARYIAKETGQYGKTTIEAACIDSVIYTIKDLMPLIFKIRFGKSDSEKATAKKELEEKLATTVVTLEKFLCDNGGGNGWLVGQDVSLADIHFFWMFDDYVKPLNPNVFASAPKLNALYSRVGERPGIKKWLAERPHSEF